MNGRDLSCVSVDAPLADEKNINDRNPLFVDAEKRRFRLQKGSPDVGAGKGGVTIGALEYPNLYYVDPRHPAAADEPAWGYPGVPLATLAKAMEVAQAGETVVLRGGVYSETLEPGTDGVTGWFTVRSRPVFGRVRSSGVRGPLAGPSRGRCRRPLPLRSDL